MFNVSMELKELIKSEGLKKLMELKELIESKGLKEPKVLKELIELKRLKQLKKICEEGEGFKRVFAIRWKDIEGVKIEHSSDNVIYEGGDVDYREVGDFVEISIYDSSSELFKIVECEEVPFCCTRFIFNFSDVHHMESELILFTLEAEDNIIYLKHLNSDVRLLLDRKYSKITWGFENSEIHQMNLKYPLVVDHSYLISYKELSSDQKASINADMEEKKDTKVLEALEKYAKEKYSETCQEYLELGNAWKETVARKRSEQIAQEKQASSAGLDDHVKKKVKSRF